VQKYEKIEKQALKIENKFPHTLFVKKKYIFF